MAHLEVSEIIPASRSEVFQFLSRPETLPLILRDHIETEVLPGAQALARGSEFEFRMSRFGFSQIVRLRVEDFSKDQRITLRLVEGPFKEWAHSIRLEDHGDRQTLVSDYVDYALPFGIFGFLADDLFVHRDMQKVLEDRLRRLREQFSPTGNAS